MDDALLSVDVKPVAPDYITPDEFAKHYGWSPRKIREIARKIGACRIMGNRMILLQADIDAILEFSRPEPAPPNAGDRRTGSALTGKFRSPDQDYADLLAVRAASKAKMAAISPKKGGHVKLVAKRLLEKK